MKKTIEPIDYKGNVKPAWCPGCGNHSVINAMFKAFTTLQIDPDNLVVASGIGCSSRIPYFINSYGFHGVHGRALPLAIGIKATNPRVRVVVAGGDGDGFSIGGNHLLHAARKNPDMTYIVMDNAIYGLTKGQNSPTSPAELHTKINPYESLDDKINPVLIALGTNISFIARGFAGDNDFLTNLIIEGMEHRGFSFIHVMSPCVQYNTYITYDYLKKNKQLIPEDHDISDRAEAVKLALAKTPLYMGIFYRQNRSTLRDRIDEVKDTALHSDSSLLETKNTINNLMEQFK